ncbi:hypothetical protein AVEN_59536-1 [Araneus ventricosus]|uniref:Uncharacterized protein n=1 Tax=Araneus ventricosus TaxID=182803 RepID=A0A4Y2V0E3_ARAVE|nr:hypothetical protein AVEN_59536-1 [Araneus ventricosus]
MGLWWLWSRRVPGSKPIPLQSVVYWACCTLNHMQRANILPLVWCDATHPDPAYPTGFKALKSRRGRELTSSSRRTPAPLAFIKSFSSYIHTALRNMGGN